MELELVSFQGMIARNHINAAIRARAALARCLSSRARSCRATAQASDLACVRRPHGSGASDQHDRARAAGAARVSHRAGRGGRRDGGSQGGRGRGEGRREGGRKGGRRQQQLAQRRRTTAVCDVPERDRQQPAHTGSSGHHEGAVSDRPIQQQHTKGPTDPATATGGAVRRRQRRGSGSSHSGDGPARSATYLSAVDSSQPPQQWGSIWPAAACDSSSTQSTSR